MALTTAMLTPETWDDFAALVEAHNGVWGGAYLHTGPEELYAGFGFERDRRIAKWRWVVRLDVPASTSPDDRR